MQAPPMEVEMPINKDEPMQGGMMKKGMKKSDVQKSSEKHEDKMKEELIKEESSMPPMPTQTQQAE